MPTPCNCKSARIAKNILGGKLGYQNYFCNIGTVSWIEGSSMRRKSDLAEMNDELS
jgi:hypothetical protein